MYLVTMIHPEMIRIQTVKYRTIKEAQTDAAAHGFVIQSVQKITKKKAAA